MILRWVLLLGVVLLVLAIGMRACLEPSVRVLPQPAMALRAMVAMYLALPGFVLLLLGLVPLQAPVGAVLLAFTISPVLPPWARKATALGGRSGAVIGLQLLSTVVALLVIPLMIRLVDGLFAVPVRLDPLMVEGVLLVTVAAPLALGAGLAQLAPAAAPRLAALADRLGGVLLLLGAASLLVLQGPAMVAVLGHGTLLLIVAVVAFGLLVGDLLGGPDPVNRAVIASATVHRHPAVALVLASGAAAQSEPGPLGAVLLYLLVSLLLPIPYERWRRQA